MSAARPGAARARGRLDEAAPASIRLAAIADEIVACRRCPELRAHCAEVGSRKRPAFADCVYWARPVPGFGDPSASILIVGLAPAAHGANRTGRLFTGDRSGDFLFAGLHRVGLASRAESVGRDDGLELRGTWITAALRCAPPANRPEAVQLRRCRPHLVAELRALKPRVIVALGAIGWNAAIDALVELDVAVARPRPRFGHGAESTFAPGPRRSAADLHPAPPVLLGCYHVSQQNTFTRRLVPAMLDAVLRRAIAISASGAGRSPPRVHEAVAGRDGAGRGSSASFERSRKSTA
ncbi:MAG TPA: uracil-DNA glycosylase [Phycisphaerales bacterium]|nr:uracil-DNA glycosylase [Phycisphaerales bacterium]HMP35850.1 uracil-DNA glycosylase [Phycisphaerales bacterium]